MPLIALVRHGQASFGAEVYDELSATGRRQSPVVGRELARRGLRNPVVCCGTLVRQRDTAELLVEAGGFTGPVQVDDRWNEYDHIDLIKEHSDPSSAGMHDAKGVQALLDEALDAWIRQADPEGWMAFSGGANAALADLAAGLGRGRDAVVVTSGGVLAAICGAMLNAPPEGIIALNRVAVNAAVTTLVVGSSGTSLLSFNDHAHFAGEHRALLTYR